MKTRLCHRAEAITHRWAIELTVGAMVSVLLVANASAVTVEFSGVIQPSSGLSGLLDPLEYLEGSPVSGSLTYDPTVGATWGDATTALYLGPNGSLAMTFVGLNSAVTYRSVNPLVIQLAQLGRSTALSVGSDPVNDIGVLVANSDPNSRQVQTARVFVRFSLPGLFVNGIGTPLPGDLGGATGSGNINTDNLPNADPGLTGFDFHQVRIIVPVPPAVWTALGLLGELGLVGSLRRMRPGGRINHAAS